MVNPNISLHYKFINNLKDDSGNLNDATITGTEKYIEEGDKPWNTFSFDGISYTKVPDNSTIKFGGGDFSISLWAKIPLGASGMSLISKGAYFVVTPAGFGISSAFSPAQYHFDVADGTNRIAVNFLQGLAWNTWKNLIAIRRGTIFEAWVNGIKVNSVTSALIGSTDNTLQFRVGNIASGANRLLKGQVADVYLYPRAITNQEIANLALFSLDKGDKGLAPGGLTKSTELWK